MKLEDDLSDTPSAASQVFGSRLPLAEAYHRSLATTAAERGFIGPREIPRLWERHILNCAVIGEVIEQRKIVIDVGSGAGLPGFPLAIARPDLKVILLEPLLKRFNYLKEISAELGLDNVTVLRGRAEEKEIRKSLPKADVVTSRAVAPLGKLTRWSLPLSRRKGVMLAMKGSSAQEEITRDATHIKAVGGGSPRVITVGEGVVDEPATIIVVQRER